MKIEITLRIKNNDLNYNERSYNEKRIAGIQWRVNVKVGGIRAGKSSKPAG
ncbi:hypothetical protein DAMNIGENAA_16570 [Desulforhabdus amnigena]|jgi:hypothetical protein|uniref:Uncharacterized protein n=1 Tax=Desulforhabdus amnigena TaxID=40218 RepID=A0A9W6D3H1_9BACT|nr:hypothetical protein DAMNIGENAA_16570 [Desulforhabdus amnigena]